MISCTPWLDRRPSTFGFPLTKQKCGPFGQSMRMLLPNVKIVCRSTESDKDKASELKEENSPAPTSPRESSSGKGFDSMGGWIPWPEVEKPPSARYGLPEFLLGFLTFSVMALFSYGFYKYGGGKALQVQKVLAADAHQEKLVAEKRSGASPIVDEKAENIEGSTDTQVEANAETDSPVSLNDTSKGLPPDAEFINENSAPPSEASPEETHALVDESQEGNQAIEEETSIDLSEIVSAIRDEVPQIQSLVYSLEVEMLPNEEQDDPHVTPPAPLSLTKLFGTNIGSDGSSVGRVVVSPQLDPSHVQTMQALQAIKVIDDGVIPGSICSRRQYARWLLAASNVLSRDSSTRILPSMFVEGVTEQAFSDVPATDPDFPAIQGLAECGLIASQLSQSDLQCDRRVVLGCAPEEDGGIKFGPDSALTRQDLVSWRLALGATSSPLGQQLPLQAGREQLAYLDVDKIHPVAVAAIAADLNAGTESVVATAFGFTRRFDPSKPVTCLQAAVSLSVGELGEVLTEELSRMEAEQIAEAAVHLVAEEEANSARVQRHDLEKEREKERREKERIEQEVQEARRMLAELRTQRESEWRSIEASRAAVEAERRLLRGLREESEDRLGELGRERERLDRLKREMEEARDRERAALLAVTKVVTEADLKKALAGSEHLSGGDSSAAPAQDGSLSVPSSNPAEFVLNWTAGQPRGALEAVVKAFNEAKGPAGSFALTAVHTGQSVCTQLAAVGKEKSVQLVEVGKEKSGQLRSVLADFTEKLSQKWKGNT